MVVIQSGRQVWKECADNPVYPQEVPGSMTVQDGVLVPQQTSENTMLALYFEYRYGHWLWHQYRTQGDSRYIVNTQLVEYGQAEFNVDAAITKIVRPSMDIEHQRFNPICMQPAIVIRNGGKETLTKIIIEYGTDNQILGQHEWTGNLQFMQTTLLDLPVLSPSAWSDSGTFLQE